MSVANVLDTREFRNALGHFATGVAVVTAEVDSVKLSCTVSSFNAVSLEPPLILFSLARSAASFDLWRRVDHFAAVVLTEEQAELSTRFAKGGSDKWQSIVAAVGRGGVPMVPGGLACFGCDVYARYDGGDHEIYVGRVEEFSLPASDSRPLIFFRGKYHSLSAGA